MVVPNLQHKQPYIPTPTRSSAVEQLDWVIQSAASYTHSDNPETRLGAALRFRLLGEWEVWRAVTALQPGALREQLTDCLAWRSYSKGWLALHPSFWNFYREQCHYALDHLTLEQQDLYDSALAAETGKRHFDLWTKELMDTGWLPHGLRLQYRRYWVRQLQLPWVLGAAFFMSHLLDGDSAVNTLYWCEVSGDSLFKRFAEKPMHPLIRGTDAHLPCLSLSPSGLLVTPEDLSPEVGQLADGAFSSVAVFYADDVTCGLGFSSNVKEFCKQAVLDCGKRACANWHADLLEVAGEVHYEGQNQAGPHHVSRPTHMRVYAGRVTSWTDSVVRWALRENLRMVRLYIPVVGPYYFKLGELRRALQRVGVRLSLYRRQWDSNHHPHSGGSFEDSLAGFVERSNASLLEPPGP